METLNIKGIKYTIVNDHLVVSRQDRTLSGHVDILPYIIIEGKRYLVKKCQAL